MNLAHTSLLQRGRPAWVPCLLALVAAGLIALVAAACDGGSDEPAVSANGDRTTITLAVVDDSNRRAALYAVEQGIAASETVDLGITYLPSSAISDAATGKLYDIIEVSPLEVALEEEEGPEFVVLSAGMQNTGGTLLFVDADSRLSDLGDLEGKTVAVASLDGIVTLDTRYLLKEAYGLDARLEGGDVTIRQKPAEALSAVVSSGEADAAVMVNRGAFAMLEDDAFRVLSHVTADVNELLGAPVMNSVLVTYPEIAGEKADALIEVNRMLAESVTYFKANRDEVIGAVETEQESAEYLKWWWQGHDLLFGDLSVDAQELMLGIWEVAKVVGDIDESPDLATVIFDPASATPEAEEGG